MPLVTRQCDVTPVKHVQVSPSTFFLHTSDLQFSDLHQQPDLATDRIKVLPCAVIRLPRAGCLVIYIPLRRRSKRNYALPYLTIFFFVLQSKHAVECLKRADQYLRDNHDVRSSRQLTALNGSTAYPELTRRQTHLSRKDRGTNQNLSGSGIGLLGT